MRERIVGMATLCLSTHALANNTFTFAVEALLDDVPALKRLGLGSVNLSSNKTMSAFEQQD